jgi:hypothetical protein
VFIIVISLVACICFLPDDQVGSRNDVIQHYPFPLPPLFFIELDDLRMTSFAGSIC